MLYLNYPIYYYGIWRYCFWFFFNSPPPPAASSQSSSSCCSAALFWTSFLWFDNSVYFFCIHLLNPLRCVCEIVYHDHTFIDPILQIQTTYTYKLIDLRLHHTEEMCVCSSSSFRYFSWNFFNRGKFFRFERKNQNRQYMCVCVHGSFANHIHD